MDTTKELPTVISFCSGYGGIERGLDLAGFEHRVIAYVEIEAFAIANLVNKMEAGQLPPAPIYTDIKTFPAHLFRDRVDLITGGYPCQPFSAAGQRKGTDDPRHLWPFIRRHIESIRPVQCFFENVEGHISLGLSTVISDLGEDGYRAAWGIFSASEVGAPHQRKRVYILADRHSQRELQPQGREQNERGRFGDCREELADTDRRGSAACGETREGSNGPITERLSAQGGTSPGGSMAVPVVKGLQGFRDIGDTGGEGSQSDDQQPTGCGASQVRSWLPEPRVGRVVDGRADRVDRIRMLGNAVVPQTAAKAWIYLN